MFTSYKQTTKGNIQGVNKGLSNKKKKNRNRVLMKKVTDKSGVSIVYLFIGALFLLLSNFAMLVVSFFISFYHI